MADDDLTQNHPGPPLADLDWIGTPLEDEEGTRYEPFFDGWTLGYKVTPPDGVTQWVYLNPSSGDTNGESNVFVYHDEGDELHFMGAQCFLVTYPDNNDTTKEN